MSEQLLWADTVYIICWICEAEPFQHQRTLVLLSTWSQLKITQESHHMRVWDNFKLAKHTELGLRFYCMLMRMGSAVTPHYPGSSFKNKWTPNCLVIFEKWGGILVSTWKFTKPYPLWKMTGNDENMTFYAFSIFLR